MAGLLAVTAACGSAATAVPPTEVPTATPETVRAATATPAEARPTQPLALKPIVRVGGLEYPVELAVESEDRIRGLSGRASLDAETGMLFVFEQPDRFRFWMKEMQFSLDIVWISSECRVVDVSENVPFPDPSTPTNELPRYSPESLAQYVLEINGGEAVERGLGIGDNVEFAGGIEGMYGC